MLLIICGHIIMVHGYQEVGDFSWYIKQLVRPFCSVAVNVFILISGYFGINLAIKKLMLLNWMVTFYCIAFLYLGCSLGIHSFTPRKDWMYLVPVFTRQYWFITVYFALCLMSPFLNNLVEVLDKDRYKRLLLTCFGLFVILPTFAVVLGFKSITLDSGYGLINFMFLYMLGRYLKLHFVAHRSKYVYIFAYIGLMSVMAAFQIYYSKLLGFDFDALISYDTIFIFTGSVFLFMYFMQLNVTCKIVNVLAVPCFAVYVIHMNPIFFHYFSEVVLHTAAYNCVAYFVCLIIYPIILYYISDVLLLNILDSQQRQDY